MYRLGALDVDWHSLPPTTQKHLQRGIWAQAPQLSAYKLGRVLTGLSQMGVKFNELHEDLQREIEVKCCFCT